MSTITFHRTTSIEAEEPPDSLGSVPSIHRAASHTGGVGIVGAGHVGAAVANALVLLGATPRVVLYDRRARRAEGEAWDIADDLTGTYTLPGQDAMRRDIDRQRNKMRKRYVASKRHTIQADFDDYMRELHHERRAGARHAPRRQPTRIASPTPRAQPVRDLSESRWNAAASTQPR